MLERRRAFPPAIDESLYVRAPQSRETERLGWECERFVQSKMRELTEQLGSTFEAARKLAKSEGCFTFWVNPEVLAEIAGTGIELLKAGVEFPQEFWAAVLCPASGIVEKARIWSLGGWSLEVGKDCDKWDIDSFGPAYVEFCTRQAEARVVLSLAAHWWRKLPGQSIPAETMSAPNQATAESVQHSIQSLPIKRPISITRTAIPLYYTDRSGQKRVLEWFRDAKDAPQSEEDIRKAAEEHEQSMRSAPRHAPPGAELEALERYDPLVDRAMGRLGMTRMWLGESQDSAKRLIAENRLDIAAITKMKVFTFKGDPSETLCLELTLDFWPKEYFKHDPDRYIKRLSVLPPELDQIAGLRGWLKTHWMALYPDKPIPPVLRDPMMRIEGQALAIPLSEQDGGESASQTTVPPDDLRDEDVQSPGATKFVASEDYRSVNLNGIVFPLTVNQARVIQRLHEAHLSGAPGLSQDTVLEKLNISSNRFLDVFKENPAARKALIVSAGAKGVYRLNL